MEGPLDIKLIHQKIFELKYFTITCNAYNQNTELICYGTKEGSLIYTQECNGKLQFKNRNVIDTPIYNVTWINETQIACSFSDSTFVIFDIFSDKILYYEDTGGSIRFIKNCDTQTFYTCGRDKLVKRWDLRIMKPIAFFDHEGTVTCIDFASVNIFYTASTPGTIINLWDTRYTEKGKNFAIKASISNSYCRDLAYFKNNLYSKNILSQIHKISQTTKYNNLVYNTTKNSYCGSMCCNKKYDLLFTCVNKEIFAIGDNYVKKVYVHNPYKTIGCISYKEDYILVNTSHEILKYEINPMIH